MRWLVLLAVLGGCDDDSAGAGSDLAMPDLAVGDLAPAQPCTPPPGGFCVYGTVTDFTTLSARAGTHVAVYDAVAFLANPTTAPLAGGDGPSYSITVGSAPSSVVLQITGSGLTPSLLMVGAAPADAFQIDPFAIPSSLASDGALELFYSDFSPSPIKQTLAAFHPVSGVTVTVAGADGGTGAQYVGSNRATLDPGAAATTGAGAALVPAGSMVDASGGSCAGPCVWSSQTVHFTQPGMVLLVPRYQ